jgi:hypothetical protein
MMRFVDGARWAVRGKDAGRLDMRAYRGDRGRRIAPARPGGSRLIVKRVLKAAGDEQKRERDGHRDHPEGEDAQHHARMMERLSAD